MLTRRCDSCKSIIVNADFVQLTKRDLKTDLDNNQKVLLTVGDYCETCISNGNAFKDLMGYGTH